MICAEYFPRSVLASKDTMPWPTSSIKHVLPFKPRQIKTDDRRISFFSKKSWNFQDDLNLIDLKVLSKRLHFSTASLDGANTLNQITVDDLIEFAKNELSNLREVISTQKENLLALVTCQLESEKLFLDPSSLNEPDTDLSIILTEERQYIDYLENQRLNKLKISSTFESNSKPINKFEVLNQRGTKVIDSEAYVCQICNGGDTHESNAIVFCSRCSITVHQQCYRLKDVPASDWVCDLCQAFESKGRFMACPMCTRRGGAMVKTDCLSTDPYIRENNPVFALWDAIKKVKRGKKSKNERKFS